MQPLPLPQPLREPLQPMEANSNPNYMDVSRQASSRAIQLTPAFVRCPPLSGIEWFTGLSESDKAALLNSLKSSLPSVSSLDALLSVRQLDSWRYLLAQGHRGFHDDSIGLEMDGSGAPGPHEVAGMEEGNDAWTQSPDDGPTDIDEPPSASSLQFTMRTVQQDYQKKRSSTPIP
ncbi:hypothetical protein B0H14DRAFT_3588680 [Mycena olivaceomarginata]|nr:hypothetical protein B0H14DRAFT_3588680 [Mycena olivaceomarginata]